MSGEVVRGRVSPDGKLVVADAPLLALQVQAGGAAGGTLVIPALTHLVRLAQRLGVTIARPVRIASTTADISMWVRMKPDADGVDLSIIEWEEQPRQPDPIDPAALGAHAELGRDGWIWQVDAALRFRAVDGQDATAGHVLPGTGEALSAYFRLIESEGEASDPLPLLSAVAARRPFSRQAAVLRADEGVRYSLAALPTFDALGRLTGYRGKAVREGLRATEAGVRHTEPYSPTFSRRLDNALRQPLGRIVANANTISSQLQGPLREDYAAYAADIVDAGRHLIELVDDLSDLQAIERPDFTVAQEEVDLADLGRRAAGLLKVRAGERSIAILTPGLDERVLATAEYRRVLQILVNLIGNAVRYSPDGSRVWVQAQDDPAAEAVRIIVADQGRGIDAVDQERIFERFERLVPEDNLGSGLGLYISRRLARAMGGDIGVESVLGDGARFTLTLPRWLG